MKTRAVTKFLRSRTAGLAASYLGIIIVLSVGFSYVLYKTATHELGRQIPPTSLFRPFSPNFHNGANYHHFFQERIAEGRGHLLGRLVLLNLFVLVVGAAFSYYLARRTLQPIENAMAAQNRFVTDASHELRTPLTAILTSNEVAMRKPHITLGQAKDVIKSNMEEMIKLKGLSDGLLSLARQDGAIIIKPVSLQDVAGESMNRILQAAQAKHISIQDDVSAIKVAGDKQSLIQAFTTLLDNAVKYSPKDSTIRLEAHEKDNRGYLSVTDEGVGISPKDLPHIFDRFYRADLARTGSNASGYGIGLSIAQKIMEQHHGGITVSSTLGKGSTFVIQLPLAQL